MPRRHADALPQHSPWPAKSRRGRAGRRAPGLSYPGPGGIIGTGSRVPQFIHASAPHGTAVAAPETQPSGPLARHDDLRSRGSLAIRPCEGRWLDRRPRASAAGPAPSSAGTPHASVSRDHADQHRPLLNAPRLVVRHRPSHGLPSRTGVPAGASGAWLGRQPGGAAHACLRSSPLRDVRPAVALPHRSHRGGRTPPPT